jgi:hypothetical protein
MSDFCAFCGKELPPDIRQRRHRGSDDRRPLFCGRAHQVAYYWQKGHYRAISAQGREARSEAVRQSNHLQPRRRRKAR